MCHLRDLRRRFPRQRLDHVSPAGYLRQSLPLLRDLPSGQRNHDVSTLFGVATPIYASSWPTFGEAPVVIASSTSGSIPSVSPAAIATLYIVSMTMILLDLLRSRNTIIVDGGLAKNPLYLGLLAGLLPGRTILRNQNAEGTASGAAALAWEGQGEGAGFSDPCRPAPRLDMPGLGDYHRRWQDLVAGSAEAEG